MKKPTVSSASSNVIGLILLLGFITTSTLSGLKGIEKLQTAFQSQWHHFSDGLSAYQPHRTNFPH